MAVFLAIIQIALAPMLLAVALAVRFAGNSKPLNVVDYDRVTDRAALHRWAGDRLLLAPAIFFIGGLASLRFPELALLFLGGATIACLCAAAWLALGSERFQSAVKIRR